MEKLRVSLSSGKSKRRQEKKEELERRKEVGREQREARGKEGRKEERDGGGEGRKEEALVYDTLWSPLGSIPLDPVRAGSLHQTSLSAFSSLVTQRAVSTTLSSHFKCHGRVFHSMTKEKPWSQTPSSQGTVQAGFAHGTPRMPENRLEQINAH